MDASSKRPVEGGGARAAWPQGAALAIAIALAVNIVGHVHRTSPAVVAPDMLADLSLLPSFFAAVTAAYFLAATVVQAPGGMLFDRLGLRLTVPVMLFLGAVGAATVAMADGPAALIAGRAIAGLGCGALIMGGVVLCARWTPRERFPAILGLVLGLGQLGNIFSTTPMAYLSAAIGWRGAMLVIAGITFVLGIVYFVFVREPPPDATGAPAEAEGVRSMIRGSWQILSDRRLWPVFVLGFVGYASLFLIWGLWGGVYLHLVHGLDLVARGNVLFVTTLGMTAGLIFFGWLAGRLGSAKLSVMIGGVGATAGFAFLALVPQPSVAVVTLSFAAIGFCGGFCGTIITHGRQFYPSHLIGRGVTVLNMMVIGGATTMQALSGVLVRVMGEVFPSDPDAVFRTLFAAIAICLAIGLLAYRRADAQPDMIGDFRVGFAGRTP